MLGAGRTSALSRPPAAGAAGPAELPPLWETGPREPPPFAAGACAAAFAAWGADFALAFAAGADLAAAALGADFAAVLEAPLLAGAFTALLAAGWLAPRDFLETPFEAGPPADLGAALPAAFAAGFGAGLAALAAVFVAGRAAGRAGDFAAAFEAGRAAVFAADLLDAVPAGRAVLLGALFVAPFAPAFAAPLAPVFAAPPRPGGAALLAATPPPDACAPAARVLFVPLISLVATIAASQASARLAFLAAAYHTQSDRARATHLA